MKSSPSESEPVKPHKVSASDYPRVGGSGHHARLAAQSGVVLRLGTMLLSAGAGSFRVKASMSRLARAVGIEEHRAQVTYTEVITSAYANGTFRTELSENRTLGVNADRIDALRRFTKSLHHGMSVEQCNAELDVIAATKPLYGWFLNALAASLACAAFAFLNKGGFVECAAVAVASFFGQAVRRWMIHRNLNHFGVWLVCSAIASFLYVGLVLALQHAGFVDHTHQAGMISAILFLVPGFPLVTAILDLVRMDYSSGITRSAYVIMVMTAAGISVWSVSKIFHWSLNASLVTYELAPGLMLGLRIVTSFIAAFGFAMLFNSPYRVCAVAGLIGAVVNTCRLLLVDQGIPNQLAVGGAALGIGLLAALFARYTSYSRVTLSVPAVVIMIPGSSVYQALNAANDGWVAEALEKSIQALFVITALGVGLAVARMLTDRGWAYDTATAKLPDLKDIHSAGHVK